MARILIISDEVTDVLKKLVAKAAERPTTYDECLRLSKIGPDKENPLNNDLTVTIPNGYRVTYTEEYQRPDVRCRHMSVSVEDGKPGTGPNPHAVVEICKMIGFKNQLQECAVYVGTLKDGRLVINVVEPLSGDMNELRK